MAHGRNAQEIADERQRRRASGGTISVVPTTNAMTAAVNVTEASRFSDRGGSLSLAGGGTVRAMTVASATASGTYPRKMNRQLARLVTIPPTTKPLAPAAAPDALQAAMARLRSGPSGVIVMSSPR